MTDTIIDRMATRESRRWWIIALVCLLVLVLAVGSVAVVVAMGGATCDGCVSVQHGAMNCVFCLAVLAGLAIVALGVMRRSVHLAFQRPPALVWAFLPDRPPQPY